MLGGLITIGAARARHNGQPVISSKSCQHSRIENRLNAVVSA